MIRKMQAVFVVAALATLAAGNSVATDEDCPIVCPALFAPTCATNGLVFKEFDNPCQLKVANCQRARSSLKPFTAVFMEWCTSEKVENLMQKLGALDLTKPECLKPCAMIYAPVCASDGRFRGLVSNECEVELINCVLGSEATPLKILQKDSC